MANKLRPWMMALALSVPMSIAMAANDTLSVDINVTLDNPTVTALSSDINPSQFNQTVTFKASVLPIAGNAVPAAVGTVTFFIDGLPQATVTLDATGIASLSTSALTVGDHVIQAQFNGDGGSGAGNPSLSGQLTQTVKNVTTTTLSLPNSPALISALTGVSANLVANVSSGAGVPTGTVTFTVDGMAQPPVTLVGGTVTLPYTFTLLGNHAVSVAYGGDANFAPSVSVIGNQVVRAAPVVTLSSSQNPAQPGQNITFMAQVASIFGTPSGTVSFTIDSGAPSVVTLVGGVATLSTSSLGLGSHPVTADFSGDADFTAGNHATLTQVIANAAPLAADDTFTIQQDTTGNVLLVLANDSDVINDVLIVTGLSNQSPVPLTSGTLSVAPDQKSVLYTPLAGFVGVLTFDYLVSDGHGGTDTGSVTVIVSKVNVAPVFTSSAVTAATQGALYTYNITTSDANSDTMTITAITLPSWLTFTPVSNGSATLTGTPGSANVGNHSVVLQVSDGTATALQSFTITVANVNDPPVNAFAIPNQTATEGSLFSFTFAPGTFTDADGDVLTYTATLSPSGALPAWLIFSGPTRTFSGTPVNADVGSITIRVTASDGGATTATADFVLTVNNLNNPPVAAADSYTVAEDSTLTANGVNPNPAGVLANDSDPDAGTTLSAALQVAPLHGTLALNADGTFVYTPAPNYNGPDEFYYLLSDGNGGTAIGHATITVTAAPDAPVNALAIPNQTATEGSLFSFTFAPGTFTDADGDVLTYTATLSPSGALPAWLSFSGPTRTFGGTPANADVGAITIRVTASDGGATTATADFVLTVNNLNNPPVAGVDSYTVAEDSTLTANGVNPNPAGVLANDSDPDAGTTLSASLQIAPLHGTLALNADGTFVYTPTANYNGSDDFYYLLSDGNGGTAIGHATITVTAAPDAPVNALAIPDQTATEGSLFSFTFAPGTFTDADSDVLTYTATLSPSGALPGWLSFDGPTRTFSGTPANADVGAITIRVTASDGGVTTATADFVLTVNNINNAPAFTSTPILTATQGALYTYSITSADVDSATLTVNALSLPGWLALSNVTATGTATLSGIPNNSDVGPHTVVLQVTDGPSNAIQSFTVTVSDINDAPTIISLPNLTIAQGQGVNVQSVGLDIDPAAPNNTLTYAMNFTPVVTGTPNWLTIDTNTGFISGLATNKGSATITVTVTDGAAIPGSAQTSFTITVIDTNNAPTIASISNQTVLQGGTLSATAVGSDIDPAAPNNTLTYSIVSGPAWVSINPNTGAISGTAPNNGGGTVTVRVSDGGDPQGSAQTSFNVTVTDVNDAPSVASLPNLIVAQGQGVNVQSVGSDIDPAAPNNTLTYSLSFVPTVAGTPNWLSINASTGFITGTATNKGGGTFTVTVTDGAGTPLSAQTSFTVTVNDTNDPPTIAAISNQTVLQGGVLSVTAVGSDIDPAAPNNALTYNIVSGPAWVSIDANTGAISGTAPNNGGGTVTVRVTDNGVPPLSAQTSFTVTVTDVNDAPTIVAITDQAVAQGSNISIQAQGADIDPAAPNKTLTYSLSGPTWLSINAASGLITGTAPLNGSGTVTVTVTDGGAPPKSANTVFQITVAPIVVSVTATANAANETGSVTGIFTISRTGNTTAALPVTFSVSGTATQGTDYQSIGTTATIPAGQSSVDVQVLGIADQVFEGDETVILTLGTGAYALGTSKQATVTLLDSNTLQLTSGPTATPNPPSVGQAVQFVVTGNGTATFAWDFGDGTTDTSGNATVTHTYALPITATVKVTATGAGGAKATGQVTVVVTPAAASSPDVDSDGDGVSDEMEIALGTDPNDAASSPVSNAAVPLPLTVTKLSISLNFASGGKDSLSMQGTLEIPAGFTTFAGFKIGTDVGGVVRAFTLDSKGKSSNGADRMTLGKPKNGLSKYTMKVSKSTFQEKLIDENMTNTTIKALSTAVTVKIIYNGLLYQKVQGQIYKSTQGRTGKAK